MRNILKYLCIGMILCSGGVVASESFAGAASDEVSQVQLGNTISNDRLGDQNGRQDTTIDTLNVQTVGVTNDAQMGSNVLSAANSVINNGANTISESAFAGANGMVTVIQNSGNQVLIQNDMVLNLFMK